MHMQSNLQHEIAILEEDRDKAETPRPFRLYISTILVNALNFAHEAGQLLITQRRGIIVIIRKKMQNLTLSRIGGL